MVSKVFLAAISTWEAVALDTGRLPPITAFLMRLPTPARFAVAIATGVWMAAHLDATPSRLADWLADRVVPDRVLP